MIQTEDILFEQRGPVALVTLNRPKALNALNLDMIRALHSRLEAWEDDPAVKAVAVRGAGDRAFCAGGDVRAIWEDGKAMKEGRGDGALTRAFFREEYRLNRRIRTFPKPYVAFLDGVAMGGGVGLSIHGSHRVVTEKTLFAMPETGIGLFPDVGATWFLPRLPGQVGTYIGLTGARVQAADALSAGVGTQFVPSERIDAVLADLAEADWSGNARETVAAVLAGYAGSAGPAPLESYRAAIDFCFQFDTVEEILSALRKDGTDWATATLKVLSQMSPTSLKLTLRAIRRGAVLDFDDALRMEYRLSQACMQGHDFYEGIRAVLVDKDRSPKWRPPSIEDVSEADIERYFTPLGQNDLSFG